jgi:hypothetical protein
MVSPKSLINLGIGVARARRADFDRANEPGTYFCQKPRMSEETRNPDATVLLSDDCIAAIKAAVARERARCAAIVRSRIGASAEIVAQAIERDGPPQSKESSTRDWRDAAF